MGRMEILTGVERRRDVSGDTPPPKPPAVSLPTPPRPLPKSCVSSNRAAGTAPSSRVLQNFRPDRTAASLSEMPKMVPTFTLALPGPSGAGSSG